MTRIVKPWIGDRYSANEVPLKILILGDSHHGNVTSEDELETIKTIKDYFIKTQRSYAFFTRIMATISGLPYWKLERQAFYHSVAFFNYVDGVAVSSSRERPNDMQFSTSSGGFKANIEKLKPDVVFCCGADVRRNVASIIGAKEFLSIEEKGIKADYFRSGGVLYFFSKHPSSGYSRYWSNAFWRFAEIEGFVSELDGMRKGWLK